MNKFDDFIAKDEDKVYVYSKMFDHVVINKDMFDECEHDVCVNKLNNYDNSCFITVTACDCSSSNSIVTQLKTICNNDLFVELKLGGGKGSYETVFGVVSASAKYSKYNFTLVDMSHNDYNVKYYFVAKL